MTMDKYSNQFVLIAANANISNKELVPYYQRRLDPKVMDGIYDKETLPKDTIQDWVNTACEVDGHMRAWNTQKVIMANSTSFRSDFLNCFHLQPALHFNSTNAPCRMNNQVVDMDINVSQKWNAAHQKHTHNSKPPLPCFNCGKSGHWNADCRTPYRGIQLSRGGPRRSMGKAGRRSCMVDIEDEDGSEPAMGNQAGVHWGMVERGFNCDHQWLPQSGHPLECVDASTSGEPSQNDQQYYIPPNRRWGNGPISHGAKVRVVFGELGDVEQKDLLIKLVQDFTWPLPYQQRREGK